jgi:hypothetical protein
MDISCITGISFKGLANTNTVHTKKACGITRRLLQSPQGMQNYFLGASAGAGAGAGAALAADIGACTGFGASTAGAGAGASSFFLQPAVKAAARASTIVSVISFFIVSPLFVEIHHLYAVRMVS